MASVLVVCGTCLVCDLPGSTVLFINIVFEENLKAHYYLPEADNRNSDGIFTYK